MSNFLNTVRAKLQGKNGWAYILFFVILPIVALAVWQSYK